MRDKLATSFSAKIRDKKFISHHVFTNFCRPINFHYTNTTLATQKLSYFTFYKGRRRLTRENFLRGANIYQVVDFGQISSTSHEYFRHISAPPSSWKIFRLRNKNIPDEEQLVRLRRHFWKSFLKDEQRRWDCRDFIILYPEN